MAVTMKRLRTVCGRRPIYGSRRQRGVVAVEFALVLPIFMGLVAVAYPIGQALYARFVLDNEATAAARVCATMVPAVVGNMQGCVTQAVATMQSAAPLPCAAGQPQVQAISVQGGPANMLLLRVDLQCTVPYASWASLLDNFAVPGINVKSFAAWPFLTPQI